MTKINKSYIKLLLLALKPNSSGYTLLESLMALVVVGILITSVAPMLALTTASRVQARRVDQATQALRSYIDGVRGGALPPPQKFVVLNPNVDFKAPDYGFPPDTSLLIGGNNYATIIGLADSGTLIDTNGNGFSVDDPQDLVIQAIRPISCPPAGPAPGNIPACLANTQAELDNAAKQGYIMALRVYRADSFANGAVPSLTEQSNVFIGGIGSRERPLVSTYAEVFPNSDLNTIKQRDSSKYGTLTL